MEQKGLSIAPLNCSVCMYVDALFMIVLMFEPLRTYNTCGTPATLSWSYSTPPFDGLCGVHVSRLNCTRCCRFRDSNVACADTEASF